MGVRHGPHENYSGAISDTKNSLSMQSQNQQYYLACKRPQRTILSLNFRFSLHMHIRQCHTTIIIYISSTFPHMHANIIMSLAQFLEAKF